MADEDDKRDLGNDVRQARMIKTDKGWEVEEPGEQLRDKSTHRY